MNTSDHLITDIEVAREIVFAGNCKFTIVSTKTGERVTYKLAKPRKHEDRLYAYFMDGCSNVLDFTYVGSVMAKDRSDVADWTPDTPIWDDFKYWKFQEEASVQGLMMILRGLKRKNVKMWDKLEFWHSSTCAACGRDLTTPDSIERRFGEICWQRRH